MAVESGCTASGAGLDPAIRQLEQTRQLAERTIFYLQRAPHLVSLQAEHMISGTLVRPETRNLLRDTELVTQSVERFSQVAAAFPAQLSAEREALIRQLSGEMLNQQQELGPLLVNLRETLDAGATPLQSS